MFETDTGGSASGADASGADTGAGEAQANETENTTDNQEAEGQEREEGDTRQAPKAQPSKKPEKSAEKAQPKSADAKGKDAADKSLAQQIRELKEEDLDALVEMNVNGKKEKVSVRQALKWGQLGNSAYDKMRKVAEREGQVEQLFRLANEDPEKFFHMTGKNAEEFAERVLIEKIRREQMSPEQLRLEELETKEQQREAEEKERQEQERAAKEQEDYKKQNVKKRQELLDAWASTGLPPDPKFGTWIAATLLREKAHGVELSPQEAAAIVKEDFTAHMRDFASKLEPDALEKFLGTETLKKWRDHDVRRVTDKAPLKSGSQTPRPPQGASANSQKTKRPMNEAEFMKFMES